MTDRHLVTCRWITTTRGPGTPDVDPCLRVELAFLNTYGVKTFSSCCGHGRRRPTVLFSTDFAGRARDLGYEVATFMVDPPISQLTPRSVDAPTGPMRPEHSHRETRTQWLMQSARVRNRTLRFPRLRIVRSGQTLWRPGRVPSRRGDG